MVVLIFTRSKHKLGRYSEDSNFATKEKPGKTGLLFFMAEREGFEPSVRISPYTHLAGVHNRPLCHLSRWHCPSVTISKRTQNINAGVRCCKRKTLADHHHERNTLPTSPQSRRWIASTLPPARFSAPNPAMLWLAKCPGSDASGRPEVAT